MEKLARQEIPAYLRRGAVLPGQVERLKQELFIAKPEWAKIVRYHEMGLTLIEMGRLLGKTADAVRHHLVRMTAAGVIAYAPKPKYAEAGRKGHAALTLMKTGAA